MILEGTFAEVGAMEQLLQEKKQEEKKALQQKKRDE